MWFPTQSNLLPLRSQFRNIRKLALLSSHFLKVIDVMDVIMLLFSFGRGHVYKSSPPICLSLQEWLAAWPRCSTTLL